MNQTPNYALPSWEATDRILMEDFNDAFETIDTAMSGFGNCKIVSGSYTGTGQTYRSEPITLPGKPLLFLIHSMDDYGDMALMMQGCPSGIAVINLHYQTSDSTKISCTWSGNSVNWGQGFSNNNARDILNESGKTYHYVALIAADE